MSTSRAARTIAWSLPGALLALGCSARPGPVTRPETASSTDPACASDGDCAGHGRCEISACVAGRCVTRPASAGTLPPDSEPGDCRRPACGESGELLAREDPADTPPQGDDPCSLATCIEGAPGTAPAPPATPCGGGGVCSQSHDCIRVRVLGLGRNHSCALVEGGEVRCWGLNQQGQSLGEPGPNALTPTRVLQLPPARQLSVGAYHGCVLLEGGRVRCWGRMAGVGQARFLRAAAPAPQTVLGVSGVVQIASCEQRTCTLGSGGEVLCWQEHLLLEPLAVRLTGGTHLRSITTNDDTLCGIDGGSAARCWDMDLVTSPDTTLVLGWHATPRPLAAGKAGLAGVTAVALGWKFGCAIREGGEVVCWGSNSAGQVAPGDPRAEVPAPVAIAGVKGATSLALGGEHACAIVAGGAVACWGAAFPLSAGNRRKPEPAPRQIEGLTGVKELSTGWNHLCALRGDGVLVCMGDGRQGALGDGGDEGFAGLGPVKF